MSDERRRKKKKSSDSIRINEEDIRAHSFWASCFEQSSHSDVGDHHHHHRRHDPAVFLAQSPNHFLFLFLFLTQSPSHFVVFRFWPISGALESQLQLYLHPTAVRVKTSDHFQQLVLGKTVYFSREHPGPYVLEKILNLYLPESKVLNLIVHIPWFDRFANCTDRKPPKPYTKPKLNPTRPKTWPNSHFFFSLPSAYFFTSLNDTIKNHYSSSSSSSSKPETNKISNKQQQIPKSNISYKILNPTSSQTQFTI